MTSESKPFSSLTILYDNIRWEEKALYESAKKRGIQVENINCKALYIDLNEKNSRYKNRIIVQRCVSYFKSLHSTAALEGLGACVVNSLQAAATCGNARLCELLAYFPSGCRARNVSDVSSNRHTSGTWSLA